MRRFSVWQRMTSPEAATQAVLSAEERTMAGAYGARLTLRRDEAAQSLGISLRTFERYVQPELKLVRMGRTRLVPIKELDRWVERNAYRLLD